MPLPSWDESKGKREREPNDCEGFCQYMLVTILEA